MLTYTQVLHRSVKVSAFLGIVDLGAALLSTFFEFSPSAMLGNLLLLEIALLFILAGLLDFSSSIGMVQFKRVVLSSKDEFSGTRRKEAERSALVYVFAGLILLAVMILLALADISTSSI